MAKTLLITVMAFALLAGCARPTASEAGPDIDDSELQNSDAPLTDQAIINAGARKFDAEKMMGRSLVLGTKNGVRVVADYPCGDLCPDRTTREILLVVDPKVKCEAAGGVEIKREFNAMGDVDNSIMCVPKALFKRRRP